MFKIKFLSLLFCLCFSQSLLAGKDTAFEDTDREKTIRHVNIMRHQHNHGDRSHLPSAEQHYRHSETPLPGGYYSAEHHHTHSETPPPGGYYKEDTERHEKNSKCCNIL